MRSVKGACASLLLQFICSNHNRKHLDRSAYWSVLHCSLLTLVSSVPQFIHSKQYVSVCFYPTVIIIVTTNNNYFPAKVSATANVAIETFNCCTSNNSLKHQGLSMHCLLPPFPVFSMRYWYMCNVKSICEFLCSSSVVLERWLLWRAAMAASRNQAAFSGVGARSSDWFCSWKSLGKKKKA